MFVVEKKIQSIRRLEKKEEVYCLASENGNFIANGVIVKNCDALRYAIYSAFPQGDFGHPDENLTIDEIRKNVYGDSGFNPLAMPSGGYF